MRAKLWIGIAVAGAVTVALGLMAFPSSAGCICCQPWLREAVVKARLKWIHEAQTEFQAQGAIDQDADGVGEFGYLAELAGLVPLPGRAGACLASPPLLGRSGIGRPGDTPGGRLNLLSGFSYEMLLPGRDAEWHSVLADRGEQDRARSADRAEREWRCVVRPMAPQVSRRAFCIDQDGLLLECAADAADAPPRIGEVWSPVD